MPAQAYPRQPKIALTPPTRPIGFAAAVMFLVLFACPASLLPAEPTISEVRGKDAHSKIQITTPDGHLVASYAIDLTNRHHPPTDPNDPLVKRFKSWRFGAFLCFSSNQYSGELSEYSESKDPVGQFRPTHLDVRQWIKTLKDAGMTHAVLTTRHTSELLLWDSATSQINVAQSRIKKDLVKDYVDECRRQGIEPGLYYCLWGDKYRPNPNARAVILAQLHELATRYGKIPYFWLDMPHWTGWLAKDLSEQELYNFLKNINPDTIVHFNNGIRDGRELFTFPTDVTNGEVHSPPAAGYDPHHTVDGQKYFIPFEYEPCSQRRRSNASTDWDYPDASWFTYGDGQTFPPSEPFPAEFLFAHIKTAYARGAASVLLSCAPDHTGQFRQKDVDQLLKLSRMLKDANLLRQESKRESE